MDKMLNNDVVDDLLTIQDILRWTISRFNGADLFFGHGTDNEWDEALRLILPSLHLPLDLPESFYSSRLTKMERFLIVDQVIKRVRERIPVAYLTNRAWFCGHEFYVDSNVLIPRSPIGELILSKFMPVLTQNPSRILDLCTGSGCIAIACAYEFEEAEIDAIDLSENALLIAEKNIVAHNFEEIITPILSDLFNAIPNQKYDLIISNPPYVNEEDLNDMPDEFLHEPRLALEAGKTGLDLVHKILFYSGEYLADNGILVCEVGNSMIELCEVYPNVPFFWFEFEFGGNGVFALTKQQLQENKAVFAQYVE